MKCSVLLQLTAVSSAFVLPNQDVLADVQLRVSEGAGSLAHNLPLVTDLSNSVVDRFDGVSEKVQDTYHQWSRQASHSIDEALSIASEQVFVSTQELSNSYFDSKAWTAAEVQDVVTSDPFGLFKKQAQSKHATDGKREEKRGHHGHKKGNHTVYELIAESKYTTKLAKLINDYPEIVEALNNTDAHGTVFAPTDQAFDKIPEHAPKPTKEQLEKILQYHISPKFYPAGRVLQTRTIPTALESDYLAKESVPQRLGTQVTLRGLVVNYYSRIVAVDIFGSNGVIHAVDSLLLPPPPILKIVSLVPEEFSTLELGLIKTGLFDSYNATKHTGGTLFAPSNSAFARLGARANAFLFSPPGLKYLKALLEYHIVPEQTLYSDYYLDGRSSNGESMVHMTARGDGPPRGYNHYDLETLLEDKSLAVDVSRYARLIDIRINGYSHVQLPDGVALDGVVHEVTGVLIPPHRHGHDDTSQWDGKTELTVEKLIQHLEPLISGAVPEEL